MAKGFVVNAHRFDPYKNFKFQIMWDGRVVVGVSKVSALKRTTEVVKHREGGDNSTDRKSPGRTSYEAITLERGVTHDPELQQALALAINDAADGDSDLFEELWHSTLVSDIVLHEGGAFDDFLAQRGHLLPADEALQPFAQVLDAAAVDVLHLRQRFRGIVEMGRGNEDRAHGHGQQAHC